MLGQPSKAEIVFKAAIGSPLMRPDTQVIVRPGWYQIITPASKSASANEISLSVMPESQIDDVITQTRDLYKSLGVSFKWCVGPWTQPSDMDERLSQLTTVSWSARGMCCSRDLMITSPSDVTVEPMTEDNLDDFMYAFTNGWDLASEDGNAQRVQMMRALSLAGQPCRYFLARWEGAPAGTAGIILKEDCAYLTGGNVLTAFRGKGVYRALIKARLNVLESLGTEVIATHAREKTSAPILEKLGFETLFRYNLYQFDI